MIHVILLLLKIIGWIFLAILALLIVSLSIFLFSAVKYQLRVASDGNLESIKAELRITWLFGIVRMLIRFKNGKTRYDLRVFKKRFSNGKDRSVPKKKEKESEKATNEPLWDGEEALLEDTRKEEASESLAETKIEEAAAKANEAEVDEIEAEEVKADEIKAAGYAAVKEAANKVASLVNA